MINPYATAFIIAARLDRAVRPSALGASPGGEDRKRWDAPRHWRQRDGEDL